MLWLNKNKAEFEGKKNILLIWCENIGCLWKNAEKWLLVEIKSIIYKNMNRSEMHMKKNHTHICKIYSVKHLWINVRHIYIYIVGRKGKLKI